jgi:peptide/nickel transport system substrate-binding protein
VWHCRPMVRRGGRSTGLVVAGAAVVVTVALVAGGLSRRRAGTGDAASIGPRPLPGCGAPAPVARPADAIPPPAVPRDGGTLVVAVDRESPGFDPATAGWTDTGFLVASALYEPLARVTEDGSVEPVVAAGLEPSVDHRRLTVRLRPGITFSDERPLDAAAVRAAIAAVRANPVVAPAYAPIRDVVVADPLTLEITFDRPWPAFDRLLAGQLGLVASPAVVGTPTARTHPVGAGPFLLDRWRPGQELVLVRNPRYTGPGPTSHVDAIRVRVVPDPAERARLVAAGEVDVSLGRSDDPAAEAATMVAGGAAVRTAHPTVHAAVLDTARAPLDDARVRRALALVTDRTALTERSGRPSGGERDARPGPVPVGAPFPPDSPWCGPGGNPGYDPGEARRLIAAYQHDHGGPVRVELQVGSSADDRRTAERLAAMWRSAGVAVDIAVTDDDRLVLAAVAGRFQAAIVSQLVPADLDGLVDRFHSVAVPLGDRALNLSRLADAEVDRLLEEERGTVDPGRRRALADGLTARLGALVPAVWLYAEPEVLAVGPRVRGADDLLRAGRGPEAPWAADVWLAG